MAKLTLTDLTSSYRSNTALNANQASIEAAVENTLSRDGTAPNAMAASLDMGANLIINVTDPSNAQDGATKNYVDTQIINTNAATADIGAITHTDGIFIVSDGTDWVGESGATARASLGLDTTANFNTALTDGSFATLAGTETLTNKTIDSATNTLTLDLSEGTLTGTLAHFNTAVSDATIASLTGSETLTNKTLTSPVLNTGVSGTAFLDEDDMASDSASKLASQQSIKAHVSTYAGVISVDTIAALKALTVARNDLVNVEGHTAAEDGGGGLFRYNSGSSATDDNGTIIQPDTGSGRWIRQAPEGFVDFAWFGPDNTGATDNWTELVAAVAAAGSGELRIPAGTYKATTPLTSSTLTPAAGFKLTGSGYGSVLAFDAATSISVKIWTLANNNISFSDIKLASTVSNSAATMLDLQGDILNFTNVWVHMGHTTTAVGGYGGLFSDDGDSTNVTFTGCRITNCRYGFVRNSATGDTHSKYIWQGCHFADNIAGNMTFNATGGPADDITINGCFFGNLYGGDNTNFGADPASIKGTENLAIGIGSVRSAVLTNLVFDGEMGECIHFEEKSGNLVVSNISVKMVRRLVNTAQTERVFGISGNNVKAGGGSAHPFEVPTNISISNVVAELKDYVVLSTDATVTMPNGGTVANLYDEDQYTVATTTTGISTTNPYEVIKVDLGAAALITYIEVENLYLSAGTSTAFQLQYSTDDITYVSLGRAITVTTSGKRHRRIASVSARYWRLARIGATDLTTTVASVGQMRLQRGKAGRDAVAAIYQTATPYGDLLNPNASNVTVSGVNIIGWDVGFQKGSEHNMRFMNCSAVWCGIGFEGKRFNPADTANRAVNCKTGGVNFLPGIIAGWSFIDCDVNWAPDTASTSNRMMIKDFHVEIEDFTIPASSTVDLTFMPRGVRARGGAENLQICITKEDSSNSTAKHKEVTRTFDWDGTTMTDTAVDNAGSGAFSFSGIINNTSADTFDMRFTDSSAADQTGFVVTAHYSGCFTVDE